MKKIVLIGIIVILIASAGLVLAQNGGKGKSSIEWCILILPSGKEVKIPCKVAEHLPPGLPITVAKIIDSCPYTITESGMYFLASNLNLTTGDYCIWVASSDVILDCKDHQITGLGQGRGIYINFPYPSENITVKNCLISNFISGISWIEVNKVNISNNILENNQWGIGMNRTSFNNISNNTIMKNTYGITLGGEGSDYNNISSNLIYNNTYGIRLYGYAIDNTFSDNTLLNNSIGMKFDIKYFWSSYYQECRCQMENNIIENNYACENEIDFSCSHDWGGCIPDSYVSPPPIIDGDGNVCDNPNGCAITCLDCLI